MRANPLMGFRAVQIPTLMPFLYQTKTLSSLPLFPRAIQRTHPSRRSIHNSLATYNRYPFDQEAETPNHRIDHSLGSGKDRAFLQGVLRYVTKHTSENISWEGNPRGTTSAKTQSPKLVTPKKPVVHNDKNAAENTDVKINSTLSSTRSLNENVIYSTQEKEPDDMDKPRLKSTITTAERMAFEHIFGDISERMGQGKLFKAEITSMVSSESGGIATPPDAVFTPKTPKEMMKVISQYPASLRAAAAKAVGLFSVAQQEQNYPASDADKIEKLRQPELSRVENLMRAAKTDVGLWQVMEREVFSLIKELGLKEDSSDTGETKINSRRRRNRRLPKAGYESNAESNPLLDIKIYGSLYPLHLLLGLQLLDQSFQKPSLLALNVLPRIKSLGLISHVLGASTALYNELLRIYCFRYDNFTGAIDLLIEMEQGALDFDDKTLGIINEVIAKQRRVLTGEEGPSLRELWSLPEFAPGKFCDWKVKINASINRQESNFT